MLFDKIKKKEMMMMINSKRKNNIVNSFTFTTHNSLHTSHREHA